MYRTLIISFLCLLSACSSIPLSTMVQFRDFDENSLLSIEPANIRARVTTDADISLKIAESKMTLELKSEHDIKQYRFALEVISSTDIPAQDGWFSSVPAKKQHELRLSSEAISNFNDLKSQAIDFDTVQSKFNVGVGFGMADDKPFPKEIVLSVALKLEQERDYIILFDNAEIPIT